MILYRYQEGVRTIGLDKLPNITTTKELGEFLKVSESTIKRAIRSGDLKVIRVGKGVRIEKSSVMDWIEK